MRQTSAVVVQISADSRISVDTACWLARLPALYYGSLILPSIVLQSLYTYEKPFFLSTLAQHHPTTILKKTFFIAQTMGAALKEVFCFTPSKSMMNLFIFLFSTVEITRHQFQVVYYLPKNMGAAM